MPSPEHWLSRWSREHPEYGWARHRDRDGFDLDDRLVAPEPGPPIARPMAPLPFGSILVASRDDALMSFDRAVVCAWNWGARLVDAGTVGHLDTAAGFGPWPLGEKLLGEKLLAELRSAG